MVATRSSRLPYADTTAAVPSPPTANVRSDLQIMHFVRVIHCSLVIGMHVWLAISNWITTRSREDTNASMLLQIFLSGVTDVDAFLVLSGMFASYQLVPKFTTYAVQNRQTPFLIFKTTVLRFWLHKLWKLAPAYYITIALTTFEHPQGLETLFNFPDAKIMRMVTNRWCPYGLKRSLLFLSNTLAPQVCCAHTWSTSITMQFYFIFPLLLLLLEMLSTFLSLKRNSKRKGTTSATKSDQYRQLVIYTMIVAAGLSAIHRWNGVPRAPSSFNVSSVSRVPNFAVGVIIGTLLSSKPSTLWLKRKRRGIAAASVVSFATYLEVISSSGFANAINEWRPTTLVYFYRSQVRHGSVLASCFIGFVLVALILHTPNYLGAAKSRSTTSGVSKNSIGSSKKSSTSALLSKTAYPTIAFLSSISYEMYLIHPSVMYWLARYLSPSPTFFRELVGGSPLLGSAVVFMATYSVSVIAGLCLNMVVRGVKDCLKLIAVRISRVLYSGKRSSARKKAS